MEFCLEESITSSASSRCVLSHSWQQKRGQDNVLQSVEEEVGVLCVNGSVIIVLSYWYASEADNA